MHFPTFYAMPKHRLITVFHKDTAILLVCRTS